MGKCVGLDHETGIKLSATAVAFSGVFLFVHKIAASESGTASKMTGLENGYWFWLASMIMALISALLMRRDLPPKQSNRRDRLS